MDVHVLLLELLVGHVSRPTGQPNAGESSAGVS